jgi:hypothetical protein
MPQALINKLRQIVDRPLWPAVLRERLLRVPGNRRGCWLVFWKVSEVSGLQDC